jgi:oligopeptide transport system substrate-binding protein
MDRCRPVARRAPGLAALLIGLVTLAGCTWPWEPAPPPAAPPTATAPAAWAPTLPTATVPPSPVAQAGHFVDADQGLALDYPTTWKRQASQDPRILTWLLVPGQGVGIGIYAGALTAGATLEQAAGQVRDLSTGGLSAVTDRPAHALTLAGGRPAWVVEYDAKESDGSAVRAVLITTTRGGQVAALIAFGAPDDIEAVRPALTQAATHLTLTPPQVAGVPREDALVRVGGESNNPRDYDPATMDGHSPIFSGLVAFNPQLQVAPDLAESWDLDASGTVYTFHLRANARFHNGRPVTAQDVIYSWERAASPAVDSHTVLTYLGDIVGIGARRAGQAEHISGLRALDDHTLQVTIDAPKPYFLMKLTYTTAAIVDRANVESGPDWYRTPNGTGPYRLIRWEPGKLELLERFDGFYLPPPPIRYLVTQLYAGVGTRLYETGAIDITSVSRADVARMRDPAEPLHAEFHESASMCTSYISFDVTQPPFDDPQVRQAFALAVDRQRYIDIVLRGAAIPAHGLYPPALPGYNPALAGLAFDPALARQRLAESRYGDAAHLPPITLTDSGFGSDVNAGTAALVGMWQATLGVAIQVENLEPDRYQDEVQAGRHGQLLGAGWCADYPDPENFADVLFHTGAEQNRGHYSNPALDRLLEQARVERDTGKRISMYQQAERMLVDDAAGIFLTHGLSFGLVKPYIQGYVMSPIAIPLERYLSIDPAGFK